MAGQNMTFGECRGEGKANCRFSVPQMRWFYLLTKPSRVHSTLRQTREFSTFKPITTEYVERKVRDAIRKYSTSKNFCRESNIRRFSHTPNRKQWMSDLSIDAIIRMIGQRRMGEVRITDGSTPE
ncbi:hypothetical protein TNCT_533041 [Trichonephila clavata]|uniref:Uncharacterized protein n=1 Tax=Trichonephila clavata TaxID=2740835 RepID=A0A8X6IYH6_TRICU|nr:hypothetical protein TNCT_533041 [Trichonephila clavata]